MQSIIILFKIEQLKTSFLQFVSWEHTFFRLFILMPLFWDDTQSKKQVLKKLQLPTIIAAYECLYN